MKGVKVRMIFKMYRAYDGMQNLKSTVVSDNIEGNHSPVNQYNRMTLRSSKKKVMGICQEKNHEL